MPRSRKIINQEEEGEEHTAQAGKNEEAWQVQMRMR
jgi:hypothetical protein